MMLISLRHNTLLLAVALTGISQLQGALLTVNEIETRLLPPPAGQGYPKAQTLGSTTGLITFSGQTLALNSLVTGAGASQQSWSVSRGQRPDRFVLVRAGITNSSRNVIWARQNGSATSVEGPIPTTEQATLGANNLYQGTDNLFTNTGNNQGNQANIERVDFLYNTAFQASANRAFVVLERGVSNAHDSFKIAAVTAVNGSGTPTAYGALISVTNWGTTSLGTFASTVMRTDNTATTPYIQSDITPATQSLGGVLITMDTLVAAGTPIYGYSLFGFDVNTTSYSLTNPSGFSRSTAQTNGGLDMVAANVGYLAEVPESGSFVLLGAGLVGLVAMRRRRGDVR